MVFQILYLLFNKRKCDFKKKEINSYCMSQKYGSNQKGYKSDLNWNYINSKDNVDEFFSELLEEKVPLIDLNYVNLI